MSARIGVRGVTVVQTAPDGGALPVLGSGDLHAGGGAVRLSGGAERLAAKAR